MLYCDQKFITALQEQIDCSIKTKQGKALLLIEIISAYKLKMIYESEFLEQTIVDLIESIKVALNDSTILSTHLHNEYVFLVINEANGQEFENNLNLIHSIIQAYHSQDSEQPIHFTTTISTVKLKGAAKIASAAINMAYLTSKNSKFEENKFHHSYDELQENKNNFKNYFVIVDNLKKSLMAKKIRLAYQPIIDSRNGAISHYECLLRLIKEDGRIISAGPFIPVVENMGFINMVDEIVLEMVFNELKTSKDIVFTFNLSSIGIQNKSWLKKLQQLIANTNLSSRLIVEITETAAHKDLAKAAYFITTLQEMGCLVALDDFGSGHTSFRQLKVLPIDIIKIDGSFVRDIDTNKENQLFVKTLVSMSKVFGLKSVAEFVENGNIAKILLEYEVDYMQGNYFCPAVNYRSWESDLTDRSN
jgi:EAL domain-containing protein (putative c-di-GMP-specific phosphodiesterase class I)